MERQNLKYVKIEEGNEQADRTVELERQSKGMLRQIQNDRTKWIEKRNQQTDRTIELEICEDKGKEGVGRQNDGTRKIE